MSPNPALANNPPLAPIIIEPLSDGLIVNAADVHMETQPFADPDPGDIHACSDFEIWTVSPTERVWAALCVTGIGKTHTHLGDGEFEGSYVGRTDLLPDTDFRLRIRFRDSSGEPGTEWSEWSERLFTTGALTEVFPMELSGISARPVPSWTDLSAGTEIILTASGTEPAVTVQSLPSNLLVSITGFDGVSNKILNPAETFVHGAVRVVLSGGGAGIVVSASKISFTDESGTDREIYLPAVNLAPSEEVYYWISANGSSYDGDAQATDPDFSAIAQTSPIPWMVLQSGFRLDIAATGFQLPVNIAFVPDPGDQPNDPYYYVVELYGTIKVVTRDGVIHDYATSLLNFDPTGQFPGSGEEGLSGVAVDSETGDLFVSLLYDDAPPSGDHFPRIIRLHSLDGGRSAATESTVIEMPGEYMGASHFISNTTVGLDGMLYVHIGDGLDPENALDLNSFRGKILRMNPDGSAPDDNPLYDSTDGISATDYIFAYGFRNPFGGTWRTLDSSHYEVENGPDANDRLARVLGGMNFGWDGTEESMTTAAIYNWTPPHAPVNIAVVQQSTFSGSGFPVSRIDRLYVTESGATWATGPQIQGKRIVEFDVSSSGMLVSGPTPIVEYNGAGKATAVAIAAGPDGIYFSDFYKDLDYSSPIDRGANIFRLKYVGTANFNADTVVGIPPLLAHFRDDSDVPDASSWRWDFGNGTTSNEKDPTVAFTHPGLYDVRLTVVGRNGAASKQRNGFIHVRDGTSILNNGDFESGSSNWNFTTDAIGTFAADVPGPSSPRAGHVNITAKGNDERLFQSNVTLKPNALYLLTFAAYSTSGHDLSASLEMEQPPNTNYGLADLIFDLPSSWNSFSTQFTTPSFAGAVNDGMLAFRFDPFDAQGDDYFVDDIVLAEIIPSITVQLVSLAGTMVSPGTVELTWSTLNETNNLGFFVERGGESGGVFDELPGSFVPGSGNSNERHDYQFTDLGVPVGDWWYRLQQVQLDSTIHYSDPVPVSVLTSTKEIPPLEFGLRQNFPNPFNPTTMIHYSLKSRSTVQLKIYNTLGQQIAELVNETQGMGDHEATFNASGVPSGIYFYRLCAGNFTKTMKMVLLK